MKFIKHRIVFPGPVDKEGSFQTNVRYKKTENGVCILNLFLFSKWKALM